MPESLLSQVKGKGKQSDRTPERSMSTGGGNVGNRPPPPQQAAPGAPVGGDSDDNGDDKEGLKKGRWDDGPARKGNGLEADEVEEEATLDELRYS